MTLQESIEKSWTDHLAKLRAAGWMVAVHNDYMLQGKSHTFWLFTNPATRTFVKGEGESDAEAIYHITLDVSGIQDSAPSMCPRDHAVLVCLPGIAPHCKECQRMFTEGDWYFLACDEWHAHAHRCYQRSR
jgi:hypothetical protein